MVWLGVGTAVFVLGCLIYYTRSGNAKGERAAPGLRQPVRKPTEQSQPTSTASTASTTQSSPSRSATTNGKLSQRMVSTPSLSLTFPGDSPDPQRTHPVQKRPQQSSRLTTPAQPAPAKSPSLSPPRLKPPTFSPMPPPPRPTNGTALRPPPSAASMLRVPPTKVLSTSSMAPSSSLMAPPSKPSRKVMLAPGHSPLDWAALTSNPNNKLRGKDVPDNFIRVSPSMLKYHNGRKGRDAWTEYHGKVYNITPYLPFHPGGPDELMKGAGRDAAKLFMEVHPWVNWDGMLVDCLVGILVAEGDEVEKSGSGGSELEEMD